MKFDFNLPTRIVFGRECIKEHGDLIAAGKKAFIVTGKSGAVKSGALGDVLHELDAHGISYTVFDNICENPKLDVCFKAGAECLRFGADFVIGIGGGSAIDAAKAIAAFAANPDIGAIDIYDVDKRANSSLPIIAVSTTAGTGSEANGTSVLTMDGGQKKKSFTSHCSFPCVSFVDPKYTFSLGTNYTVSTALDAFSHAIESYLSPKSDSLSSQFAILAGCMVWSVLKNEPTTFTEDMRERLSYGACMAGAAISVTGTGFPHPLGYSLTLLDGIPHGRACAVFESDYIILNGQTEEGREKLNAFCRFCDSSDTAICDTLNRLAGVKLTLTEEEIREHIELVKSAKNYKNSPYVLMDDEKLEIYRKHFAK